jgi:hypothetical protein
MKFGMLPAAVGALQAWEEKDVSGYDSESFGTVAAIENPDILVPLRNIRLPFA